MRDLRERVHARIGTTGSSDARFYAGQFFQCKLYGVLYAAAALLALPTAKPAPVVTQCYLISHKSTSVKKTFEGTVARQTGKG